MSLPTRLRHIVQFQEKRVIVDEDGERSEQWVSVFPRVYASVEPLSVRDLMAAGAEQSKISSRIVIRYREGVHHGMRIIHRGQVFDILGVQPDNRSGIEYLTIPVASGVRYAEPINDGGQHG